MTALTAGAVAALGPSGVSSAAVPGRELVMTFDGASTAQNTGDATYDIAVVTANGGTVERVPDRDGSARAIRLPAFSTDVPPLAVLTATDRDGADDLDPGTAEFRFGADFALDRRSRGSSTDNGNNLVQRGLFGARTQYKIQIDGWRPSCRVKGRSGAVVVRSRRDIAPDTWYRVRCTRSGSTVTLVVRRLADGVTWTSRASGATGSMTPGSSTLPLSVGGKVRTTGALMVDDSDQFNGRVDNVVLGIG